MTDEPIESGFYWVKDHKGGRWEPQEYRAATDEWWAIGCEYAYPNNPPFQIGPMIPQYHPESDWKGLRDGKCSSQ